MIQKLLPRSAQVRRSPIERFSDLSDLERIWLSEFGRPVELIARYCVIGIASYGIWSFDGTLMAPIWFVAYMVMQLVTHFALKAPKEPSRQRYLLGMSSYFLTAIIFLAVPLYLMAFGDPVLMFGGTMGIIGLAVFTLYRGELPVALLWFDIAVGWVAVAVALFTHFPDGESAIAVWIMTLLVVVVGGYYTMALIVTRSDKAGLREAARRKLEAQKMEAIGRLSGGLQRCR